MSGKQILKSVIYTKSKGDLFIDLSLDKVLFMFKIAMSKSLGMFFPKHECMFLEHCLRYSESSHQESI